MTLNTKNSNNDKSKEYVIHNLQKAQFYTARREFFAEGFVDLFMQGNSRFEKTMENSNQLD